MAKSILKSLKTAFNRELLPILKTYANIEDSIFYIAIRGKLMTGLVDYGAKAHFKGEAQPK